MFICNSNRTIKISCTIPSIFIQFWAMCTIEQTKLYMHTIFSHVMNSSTIFFSRSMTGMPSIKKNICIIEYFPFEMMFWLLSCNYRIIAPKDVCFSCQTLILDFGVRPNCKRELTLMLISSHCVRISPKCLSKSPKIRCFCLQECKDESPIVLNIFKQERNI